MKESEIISRLAAAKAFESAAKLWRLLKLTKAKFKDWRGSFGELDMPGALEKAAERLREEVKKS
jgi:hypothetical protein